MPPPTAWAAFERRFHPSCSVTGTIGRLTAARRIGDPMVGGPIYGGDGAISHDEGADIAAGFINIFLHVIDVMIVIAQRLPMLQNGFSAVAIMHARQQPPPGTGDRFQHSRIFYVFDGLHSAVRRECHARMRLRDAGSA